MAAGFVFAVICKKFREGYLQGMSDYKKVIIDPAATVLVIVVFLFIITFWGEPDLLDLLLIKLGG